MLRGSSAIYGTGASGGIVAITTRPAGGAPFAESTVSLRSPLSRLGSDGLCGEVSHYMFGANGAVGYAFNVGLQHAYSQLMRNSNNTSRLPAPGAALSVGYSRRW